ncbi:MAG TPA: archaemetzincin [Chitinivibrionales bacterium]|nr:archaemetzincin [Chitinivibrionales bacterium]
MSRSCRYFRNPSWLLLFLFISSSAIDFTPPGPKQRFAAIGPTAGLPAALRAALDTCEDFPPIPAPTCMDWLADYQEDGQTYQQWLDAKPNMPDSIRNVIYLLPLCDMANANGPPLDKLGEFAGAFFAMKVKILPVLVLSDKDVFRRRDAHNKSGQLLATDVLALMKKKLPADAFAMLGITMEDMYPGPGWNFVFGLASFNDRVGTYSFARYDPAFYGEEPGKARDKIMLKRSCKILAHEGLHIFGLAHCIFFHCVENGCNHIGEFDTTPLQLCPVDLRKLQRSVGFDVMKYYKRLGEVYEDLGFTKEAAWEKKRLMRVSASVFRKSN